jgi:hypothetical protein
MTARCDLEHGKANVINYLPIIPFQDFLHRNLAYSLANKTAKEIEQEVVRALKEKGVPSSCIATFPLQRIVDKETTGSQRKTLTQRLELFETAKAILDTKSAPSIELVRQILAKAAKPAKVLTANLIKQQISEFYFLESVDLHESPREGFVVLVRYMQTMPTEVLEKIACGLGKEDAHCVEGAADHLNFDYDPIAMVVGVLRSPDMEHLAQHFASLFTRVGLEDQSENVLEHHRATIDTFTTT